MAEKTITGGISHNDSHRKLAVQKNCKVHLATPYKSKLPNHFTTKVTSITSYDYVILHI